jgi:hypothetical protein
MVKNITKRAINNKTNKGSPSSKGSRGNISKTTNTIPILSSTNMEIGDTEKKYL